MRPNEVGGSLKAFHPIHRFPQRPNHEPQIFDLSGGVLIYGFERKRSQMLPIQSRNNVAVTVRHIPYANLGCGMEPGRFGYPLVAVMEMPRAPAWFGLEIGIMERADLPYPSILNDTLSPYCP